MRGGGVMLPPVNVLGRVRDGLERQGSGSDADASRRASCRLASRLFGPWAHTHTGAPVGILHTPVGPDPASAGPATLGHARRRGGVATQRPAKPFTPVRFRSAPCRKS